MAAIRKHDQTEILVGFDEFVDHKECIVRRNVRIESPMSDQELAFQVLREILICLVIVVVAAVLFREQSLPFITPIVLVNSIVVVSRLRYSNLEEIGITEHCVCRSVSAATPVRRD